MREFALRPMGDFLPVLDLLNLSSTPGGSDLTSVVKWEGTLSCPFVIRQGVRLLLSSF